MWNIVEIDGQYYYFDATASEHKNNKDFISHVGLNPLKLNSYSPKYKNDIPKPNGKKYNYFDFNNKSITFNKSDLSNIKTIINNDQNKTVEFRVLNHNELLNEISNNYDYYMSELGIKTITFYDDVAIVDKK